MGYTCQHLCCCAPRVVWTVPVASCQVYYCNVPAWPVYTPCTVRWCCSGCCCRCSCCPCSKPKAPGAAAPAVSAVKEAAPSPRLGEPCKPQKIEVQGKVEVTSSEVIRDEKTRSRSVEGDTSPLEWRRVSSLPKQLRAERATAAAGSASETSGHKKNSSSRGESSEEDRRCEGTFVITGLPLCENRYTRRRTDTKSEKSGRERVVKGTIVLKTE